MHSKHTLIDAIRTHNPTAPIDWLSAFSHDALRVYLDHLLSTLDPKQIAWVRPGDTPAITGRGAAT
jgi:hypothetical protein